MLLAAGRRLLRCFARTMTSRGGWQLQNSGASFESKQEMKQIHVCIGRKADEQRTCPTHERHAQRSNQISSDVRKASVQVLAHFEVT